MLVGNQIDRAAERVVQASHAQLFALQNGLLFTEISAKHGTNVDYAFRRLVHEIFGGISARGELDAFKKTKVSPQVKISQTSNPPRSSSKGCAC
ncbi:hypothetical protein FS749_007243 [Ceratobasidium sp. UAMH 11750]|nr:hypothetical protein FS749_007243 [Ceratobasidium sp. UAMH 11750]